MEVNNNEVKSVPHDASLTYSYTKSKVKRSCKKSLLYRYALPVVLAALCYYNSLNGNFVHDDIFAIKKNPDVTGGTPASKIWINDFWGRPITSNASHKSYRPLTILSFRLNYSVSGGNPFWFHVVNVILHCLTTSLLVHLLHDVLNISHYCTLFTSSLFAVHPIHTEAVSGIVGRADILAAMFFLLSIIAYLRAFEDKSSDFPPTQQPVLLVLSILFGVVSTLCKEHGVMVLIVLAAIDCLVICSKGMKRILNHDVSVAAAGPLIRRLCTLAVSFVIVFMVRLVINGGQVPAFTEQDNPAAFSSSLCTRFLTYNYLLAFNVWLMLAPITLCYDWQVGSIPLVESLSDLRNIATLIFYMVFFLIIWRGYNVLRHQKTQVNVPSISMLLLVLPFLPASNLFLTVGFVVAERILYIPSFGFCLLVGYGINVLICKFPRRKSHIITVFIAYIAILSLRTVDRNQVWQSRQSLFRSGVVTLPHNAKIHYNYANYLKDIKSTSKAIQHYQEAIRLYETYASAHNNLGTLLSNETRAEYHFRQALHHNVNHKGATVNLANILISRKEHKKAEESLEKVLKQDPNYVEALMTMSKILMATNRTELAKSYIEHGIEIDPTSPDVYNYHGVYLTETGKYEEAVDSFQKAYSLNMKTSFLILAASTLESRGQMMKAENLLERAITTSSNVDLMGHLGSLYFKTNKHNKSLQMYENILEMAPNNTKARIKYAEILIKKNERDKAEAILHNVLSHSPESVPALQLLSDIYKSRSMLEKALKYCKEAYEYSLTGGSMETISEICFRLGDIYRIKKDNKNALKYFEESIENNPNNLNAIVYAGGIHHLMNNFAEARRYYSKAIEINPNDNLAKENLKKLNRSERNHKQ